MEQFKEELTELGFDISCIGFNYWLDMPSLIKKYEDSKIKMANFYIAIAEKHHTKWQAVEIALRRTLQPAKPKIKKKFNYEGKVTTKAFINLVRDELEEI